MSERPFDELLSDEDTAKIIEQVSEKGSASEIINALVEDLQKSPEELAGTVDTLLEAGETKAAEVCAFASILQARNQDAPAPDGVEKGIHFRLVTFPTKDLTPFPMLGHAIDALQHLGLKRAKPVFEACFERGCGITMGLVPALNAFPDADDLWNRTFEGIEENLDERQKNQWNYYRNLVFGFARAGRPALPRLKKAREATDEPSLRDCYRVAAIYILADMVEAGEELPEEYIDAISFIEWNPELIDASTFRSGVLDKLKPLLKALPYDDAEGLLVEELDPDRPLWRRALPGVAIVPGFSAVQRALSLVASKGVAETSDDINWFEIMLEEMPLECRVDVQDALGTTTNPGFYSMVKKVFGKEEYEERLELAGGMPVIAGEEDQMTEEMAAEKRKADSIGDDELLEVAEEVAKAFHQSLKADERFCDTFEDFDALFKDIEIKAHHLQYSSDDVDGDANVHTAEEVYDLPLDKDLHGDFIESAMLLVPYRPEEFAKAIDKSLSDLSPKHRVAALENYSIKGTATLHFR